ncbi:MAG: hypothetical protein PHY92_01730 [Alphaproteobacteria bacterium]|nr:hypothetical protein [Alphaproteobacteria bacterium]
MKPASCPVNEPIAEEPLLDSVFGIEGTVVAVFVSDWSKLPKNLTPKIRAMSERRGAANAIQVVNVRISPEVSYKYSIPDDATNVVVYNNRQEIARSAGPSTTEEIWPWLKRELRLVPRRPAKEANQSGTGRQALQPAP